MKLSSPDFDNGEVIPEKISYVCENTNPVLEISDVPEEAESLALIMEDPDAVQAAGKIWTHWTVWNISPDKHKIVEGEAPGVEGTTDFRQTGYNGPNPPDGDHTCVFKLYALNKKLDLEEGASVEDFETAIQDGVVDQSNLEGVFEKIED